jgi:hypothetical protein
MRHRLFADRRLDAPDKSVAWLLLTVKDSAECRWGDACVCGYISGASASESHLDAEPSCEFSGHRKTDLSMVQRSVNFSALRFSFQFSFFAFPLYVSRFSFLFSLFGP